MWYQAPRALDIENAQFGTIRQERAHATHIVRVHIDQQSLADELCAARKHGARISSAVQIDMWPDTFAEVGAYLAMNCRLHQAEGTPVMFGKPREQLLTAANEIFHRLQWRDIVQPGVRRAMVARDRVLDQFLQFVE